MKRLLIVSLAIMSAGFIFGQQKVAVYIAGDGDVGIKKVLGDQLVAAIANSGKYIAIERTASFLAELGKEQNYQRTGAVDDSELSRLGKQFGVQLVCIADISEVFNSKYVSARLIDVESAEVVNAANGNSPLSTMDELLKLIAELTKTLTGETVKEKAAKELAKKQAKEAGYLILGNLAVQINVSGEVVWESANKMAQESRLAGYSDWRLPTTTELAQLKTIYREMVIPQYRIFWSVEECMYYNKEKKDLQTGHTALYFDKYECYEENSKAGTVLVRTIKK
ncbi:MAG: hypothetical protein LBP63_06920 [Prevotellaceae bacterium]|jgi:hypothetical protein|nr:hypothetical protein [Prevotellaceae bacterium]